MAAPTYRITYIPIEKLLHVTSVGSTKNNPEGRSCLRGCWVSYYCLKKIQQSEMIGISRNLQGVPCMEVPIQLLSSSATASEKLLLDSFQQMVSRVKADEYSGLVIPAETDQTGKPTGYKFKLLQTGSTGKTVEINQTIERLERSIARAFLADWLYLGSGAGSSGSWSLASVRTHSFSQALAGFLASVVDAFNSHAIPQLMRLNGVTDADLFPKLRHGDIEARPIEEVAPHVSALVTAGLMTPDDTTEEWLREILGAPQVEANGIDRPSVFDTPDNEASEMLAELLPIEPTDPEQNTEPAPIQDEGETVADVTLNGAQVASLLSIIERVTLDQLPRESALNIIAAAFNMDKPTADSLLGEVGRGFKPEETAPDARMSQTTSSPRRSRKRYQAAQSGTDSGARLTHACMTTTGTRPSVSE